MSLAPTRRAVLGGALLAATARDARAAEQARLLVAGPPGGRMDGLAAALKPALARAFAGDLSIEVRAAGGADGVTGANQFEARFEPEGDGTALLLVPGAGAAAWLAGDARVQYDAARWLPLLCGMGSGVFASRQALAPGREAAPLRVAVADPPEAGAACLLGLDALAVPARPVPVVDPAAALASGQVDAAFLPAPIVVPNGAAPVFSLGAPDQEANDGPSAGRDPAHPDVPSLGEVLTGRTPPRDLPVDALRAVTAAALLDHMLVLPPLTPAPTVALWREAALRAAQTAQVRGALAAGVRLVAGSGAGAVQSAIAIEPAPLLSYRRWLARRIGYRPG